VRLTWVATAISFSGLSAAASAFYVDARNGTNAGHGAACQDFFAHWKDADSDIPILKEAKASIPRCAR